MPKAGWKTSEAWLTGGAIPAILKLASEPLPLRTKLPSIAAVAAVSVVYTVARTWLKANPVPTVDAAARFLASQFNSPAVGGPPISTATEPEKSTAKGC